MVNDGKIFSKLKSLKFLDEVFKLLVMKRLLIMTFMSGCHPPEVDGDDGDDSVGDGNCIMMMVMMMLLPGCLYPGYLLDTWIPFCTLDIFWIPGYPFVLWISFARLLVPWISWNVLSLLVSQMAVFYAPNKVPPFETLTF